MTRVLSICSLLVSAATATACPIHVSRADAIRIAKQQIAQHWGGERVSYFGPYTAEIHDCSWSICVLSPVRDAPRYLFIAVDAQTGAARYDIRRDTQRNTRNAHEPQR